jgi:hypothetical protein
VASARGVVFDVRSITLRAQLFGDLANIVRSLAQGGVGVCILALPIQRQPFNIAALPATIVTSADEAPSEDHAPHIVLRAD